MDEDLKNKLYQSFIVVDKERLENATDAQINAVSELLENAILKHLKQIKLEEEDDVV
jgi:hypothetical protein